MQQIVIKDSNGRSITVSLRCFVQHRPLHLCLRRSCALPGKNQQDCVEPRPSALNATLPAFAAKRLQLIRGAGARSHRSIYQARWALSGKPAGRRCCCRSMGQTDGHPTVTYRPCSVILRRQRQKWHRSHPTRIPTRGLSPSQGRSRTRFILLRWLHGTGH